MTFVLNLFKHSDFCKYLMLFASFPLAQKSPYSFKHTELFSLLKNNA